MSSVNKVTLLGRVGKDPEVKHLGEGNAVANFSLATSESYKNKEGEKVETTEWHNLTMWKGLATIAEKYVKKGSQIYVEGQIKTRSWEDESGTKKYRTEILVSNLVLLGKKQEGEASEATQQTSAPAPAAANNNTPPAGNDDLPF